MIVERRNYFLERDFRRIRLVAIVSSVVVHVLLFVCFLFLRNANADSAAKQDELEFGSSGGGGGEGLKEYTIEFGPSSDNDAARKGEELTGTTRFTLLDIHVYNDVEVAKPVIKEETPKEKPKVKRKASVPIIAENLPRKWVRRGTGPGSGGGAGGGSGGGIGGSTGYSIDWGGTGSRRLLSGRLPTYPSGTDKQMAVTLQFSVLPDGSVEGILPTRKSDELLERAAISALRTWRFEPLPDQIAQRSQTGKVTFRFTLVN